MNRHLSPEEFVDAIDGVLQPARREHLDSCARCRQEIETLGTLMRDMHSDADVPAPSPLFWDHFPGRVLAADLESDRKSGRWRFAWPAMAAVGAAAVLIALPLVLRSLTPALPMIAQPVVESAPPSIEVPPADEAAGQGRVAALEGPPVEDTSPAAARSWNRVMTAGRGASAEDVLGVAPAGPGTAVLIEDLSPRELQEFARLLRAQMGGLQ